MAPPEMIQVPVSGQSYSKDQELETYELNLLALLFVLHVEKGL